MTGALETDEVRPASAEGSRRDELSPSPPAAPDSDNSSISSSSDDDDEEDGEDPTLSSDGQLSKEPTAADAAEPEPERQQTGRLYIKEVHSTGWDSDATTYHPNTDVVHVFTTLMDGAPDSAGLGIMPATECRELTYQMDLNDLLLGDLTERSLKKHAHALLDGLGQERQYIETRPIVFVAYDFGALLLKQAISEASKSKAKYPGVFGSTARVIFSNCLQRSACRESMLSNVLEILRESKDSSSPLPAYLSAARTRGLVDSIYRTSEAFLESRVSLQSRIISVYPSDPAKVQGTWTELGTLGLHSEISLKTEGSLSTHSWPATLAFHVSSGLDTWTPRSEWRCLQVTMMSLSASERQLKSGPPVLEDWSPEFLPVLTTPACERWRRMEHTQGQILLLHGKSHSTTLDTANFIIQSHVSDMERARYGVRRTPSVFAFAFDSTDPTRNSVTAMISSLIAQMMGRWGSTHSRLYETLDTNFRIGGGWTDDSLIQAFHESDLYSREGAVLLLHRLDQCEPTSLSRFLDSYRSASKRFEQALRIIVTTKQDPESIMEHGDEWGCIRVDDMFPPTTSDGGQLWDFRATSLVRVYPFDEEKEQIETALGKIASVQDDSPGTILSLVQLYTSWPADTSQEHLDLFLGFAETCVATDTSASVLDRILRASADAELVQWVIIWLYHHRPRRPLNRRDLMTVLSESAKSDRLPLFQLPSKTFAEFKRQTESLLGILVEPDREELILRPEIRKILARKPDDGSAYLWFDLGGRAHLLITHFTLIYLPLLSTRQIIEETMEEYDARETGTQVSFLGQMKVPLGTDGLDVAFKLLQSLPYHLSQSGRDVPVDQPDDVLLWTRAYWATCNPFTRGPDPAQRPQMGFCDFAAIVSGQLGDSASTRRDRYLAAAAPLPPGAAAESSAGLMGALFASVRASDRDVALSIASEIRDQAQESGVKTVWPRHLIWAAAWQDMPDLLSIFLSDGADPNAMYLRLDYLYGVDEYDADNQMEDTRRDWVSPLYAATCFGHSAVVQVLLKHGARTDLALDNDWSPSAVNMAVSHSQVEVLRLLLDHKPEELATPDRLLRLLYEASDSGFDIVMPELLERIKRKDKDDDSNIASGAESDDDDRRDDSSVRRDSTESNPINSVPDGNTWRPLMGAATYGWTGTLTMLLEAGADPNFANPDDEGDTPLWQAMWHHPSLECVRQLVKHGVDPNQRFQQIPVFLDYISKTLNKSEEDRSDEFVVEMLEVLLTGPKPMLVNTADSVNLETALIVAARQGSLLVVRWLLDHGADINMVDDHGRSAIWHAVYGDYASIVRELLGRTPAPNLDVADKEKDGSLLSIACTSLENMVALLDAGVGVNMRNGDGPTAMDSAVCDKQDNVVKLLIARGADLRITDKNGWSPLATAVVFDCTSLVRMLVDAGADPEDIVDHENLIYLAANNPDILRILLEFGKRLDIDHRNEIGRTPLIKAASYREPAEGSAEHLRILLRAGADVNAQENDGETALHNAVRSAVPSYLPVLLSSPGIEVNRYPDSGHMCTPLSLACGHGNVRAVEALLEHGADVSHVTEAFSARPTALVSTAILFAGVRDTDANAADEITRTLVRRGADVALEHPGRVFPTALSAAAFGSGLSTLNFLMDEGPSMIQVPDHFGRRPIHYAAANGIENLRALYLRDREGLSASDRGSKTVVHWAAQFGNPEALAFILEKHDELGSAAHVVDQPDGDGWTPLCWALRPLEGAYAPNMRSEPQNYAGVVEALLSRGANPRLPCYLGRGANEVEEVTPIDIARRYGSAPEVIKLLTDRLEPPNTAPSAQDEDEEKERDKSESEGESDGEGEGEGQDGGHASPTPVEAPKVYKGHPPGCDMCLMDISGLVFRCDTCREFLVCAKCLRNWTTFHEGIYMRPEDREKTHNMVIDTEFDEFEEVPVPSAPSSPKPPSVSEAEDNAKEDTDESADESDDDSVADDTTGDVDGSDEPRS